MEGKEREEWKDLNEKNVRIRMEQLKGKNEKNVRMRIRRTEG